jgi:16S rRNA (adenine1518-N6/adenine1519-N6)-dimethyltransferase
MLDPEAATVFTRLVKRAFSERRKMMFKLLKTLWPVEVLQEAFQQMGIAPTERAEKVSLEGFVGLARILSAPGGAAERVESEKRT